MEPGSPAAIQRSGWSWLHQWYRRLAGFLDDSPGPNESAGMVFQPAPQEQQELAHLAAEYPALGNELSHYLTGARRQFTTWQEAPTADDWPAVLVVFDQLRAQLRRTLEALDGPLDHPPAELLARLRGNRGELLAYLWGHAPIKLGDLAAALWTGNPDEANARRAVNRLATDLADLGRPDLVQVENGTVWLRPK